MNKSWICKFLQGLRCAYLLGKMVEAAIFKQNTIEFHSYSTSPCGFGEKIFGAKHRRYTGPGFLEGYLPWRKSKDLPGRSETC
jgi:hypothetical protein